jgi:hypothetical protein
MPEPLRREITGSRTSGPHLRFQADNGGREKVGTFFASKKMEEPSVRALLFYVGRLLASRLGSEVNG